MDLLERRAEEERRRRVRRQIQMLHQELEKAEPNITFSEVVERVFRVRLMRDDPNAHRKAYALPPQRDSRSVAGGGVYYRY